VTHYTEIVSNSIQINCHTHLCLAVYHVVMLVALGTAHHQYYHISTHSYLQKIARQKEFVNVGGTE
jgi:hypothetical protein